jgi:hypothetical protein
MTDVISKQRRNYFFSAILFSRRLTFLSMLMRKITSPVKTIDRTITTTYIFPFERMVSAISTPSVVTCANEVKVEIRKMKNVMSVTFDLVMSVFF